MDKLERIKIFRKIFRKKDKYDLYLDTILKTVRQKGVLVETMPKGTKFLFDTRKGYKKQLGAVPVTNIFGNVTNVYVVYEDFDGSIKYYDYPEYSKKDIKRMRKEYKHNDNNSKDYKLTGGGLIDALCINGQYAAWNSNFTDKEIYDAIHRGFKYIEMCSFPELISYEISFSPRQRCCIKGTIHFIAEKEYNGALHELMDCIDDFGMGRNRPITSNEYILYYSVFCQFIYAINQNDTIAAKNEI